MEQVIELRLGGGATPPPEILEAMKKHLIKCTEQGCQKCQVAALAMFEQAAAA